MKYKGEAAFFKVVAGLWAAVLLILYGLVSFLFRKKL